MESLKISKPIHEFLKPGIQTRWELLEPYYIELNKRPILSKEALIGWLKDRSELDSYLEENFAWRYIKMTSDTANPSYSEDFRYFTEEIEPKLEPWNDLLNKKLIQNPFIGDIQNPPYEFFLKKIQVAIKLYREENIPLYTRLKIKQQEYAQICGAMNVTISGETLTMEQASTRLKSNDRSVRKEAFEKIAERRMQDKEVINQILVELVSLRQEIAKNAGFDNFKDYSFESLGRFDYSSMETSLFQEAIREEIVPILKSLAEERKKHLGLAVLKPWDMDVDTLGRLPLHPFSNGNDLTDKTIECFQKLDPYFGECIKVMKEEGFLDLESRTGKAPGGYNYPLAESGAPFIFMNSAGAFRDLTTMVHEGGHAIHTFLTRDLMLNDFKHLSSEIAELASMSMELISMKHWNIFFSDPINLKRAKEEQLVDSLKTFPWVATIDKFQSRFYTEAFSIPNLTAIWNQVFEEFGGAYCDWTGYEDYRDHLWQKQLHIFEVPFYYIEYGIAGLGALAVWKNFTQNPSLAIEKYKAALSLGYTRSIPEIYKTAGIEFNMSRDYISELANFVKKQLADLGD